MVGPWLAERGRGGASQSTPWHAHHIAVLTRSFDRLHLFVILGTVAVLAGAVVAAAAGLPMSWALLLVMLAPVVSVVGYELRGHRHVAHLLADDVAA
ncbi:hypothetical protein GCM10027063_09400 [Promicromonospora xylanilytica]